MTNPRNAEVYSKPYQDVPSQLALLQEKGIYVSDTAAAIACLERIGYYRLSGYSYPFCNRRTAVHPVTGKPLQQGDKRRIQIVVEDRFREETAFSTVMDLYVFDKRLRLLSLDAIERIEVALRVDISLMLGYRSPWAHRDAKELHGNFTVKRNLKTGKTEYEQWLERLDGSFLNSKDEYIKHIKQKYHGADLPISIGIEL